MTYQQPVRPWHLGVFFNFFGQFLVTPVSHAFINTYVFISMTYISVSTTKRLFSYKVRGIRMILELILASPDVEST